MAERFAERWYDSPGQDLDVVISSRVRIARNLVDYPFPGKMSREEEAAVEERVLAAVSKATEGELEPLSVGGLGALERKVYVEEGIISQPYSLEPFRRFAVSPDASLSAVPNEVDHLRLSAFAPGLDLAGPWARLDSLDQALEDDLAFAATFEAGYLTTELSSIGTGLRASVLLHLPALSETGLVERAMKGLMNEGLGVRGFYGGEGQSSGALYQVSNTISLGDSEEGILGKVTDGVRRLVQYERLAREELAEKDKLRLQDLLSRAYAVLRYAKVVTVAECFELLSRFRLGVSLGWIEGVSLQEIDGLYYRQQKARLQFDQAGRPSSPTAPAGQTAPSAPAAQAAPSDPSAGPTSPASPVAPAAPAEPPSAEPPAPHGPVGVDWLKAPVDSRRSGADKLQAGPSSADDSERGLSLDAGRATLLRAFAGRCRLQGAD